MCVVICNPNFQRPDEFKGTGPLLEPEAFFFKRAHLTLGISTPLRVVIAGQGLMDFSRMARPHKGERCWLTPMVTHQGQALVPRARRKLVVHGHIQGRQPVPGGARPTSVIADNLLRIPIQHHLDRDPPKGLHQELGHVDTPPSIGLGGAGFAPRRWPLRLELQVGRDQEVMLPHHAQHPLLVHRPLLHEAQVSPYPAGALERVLRLERLHALEPSLMAMGDQG